MKSLINNLYEILIKRYNISLKRYNEILRNINYTSLIKASLSICYNNNDFIIINIYFILNNMEHNFLGSIILLFNNI